MVKEDKIMRRDSRSEKGSEKVWQSAIPYLEREPGGQKVAKRAPKMEKKNWWLVAVSCGRALYRVAEGSEYAMSLHRCFQKQKNGGRGFEASVVGRFRTSKLLPPVTVVMLCLHVPAVTYQFHSTQFQVSSARSCSSRTSIPKRTSYNPRKPWFRQR